MEELSEREGMLSSVEEELSDVKKLLSEKMCREQELEEMLDGRETLTALQSTLSAKDEEILRLKEDLDQHMKDLTLTQEKLQKQSSLMVRRAYSPLYVQLISTYPVNCEIFVTT
jgi:uncharacterized membrane protein (DUF106 family)